MRKVFLDNLPRKGKLIDWEKCVGYKVPFIYDNIEGEICIQRRNEDGRITIEYNGNCHDIAVNHFSKCKIGVVLDFISKDYNYNTGDIINNVKIYEKIRIEHRKAYKYICDKCGYKGEILEKELRKGQSCSCCAGKVVMPHINSIKAKAPWMIKLGVGEEDSLKYTPQSNKKIKVICPYCGKIKEKNINDIYNNKSISCICGDNKSYISKYIISVLEQLKVKYDTEVKYDWNKYINPKNNKLTQASIDFVIYKDEREIPLEADGAFHRKDNSMSGMTAEMQQDIDKQRDDNCLRYLNEETIRISDEGYIKENILNSKLNDLFDLSKIDWLKCEEFALKNLAKEVCEYWNNKEEWETVTDLEKIFNSTAIRNYLKKGTELGWCYYNPKEEMKKIGARNSRKNEIPIKVYKDGVLLYTFKSKAELERNSIDKLGVFLSSKNYSYYIKNKKEYKGYILE